MVGDKYCLMYSTTQARPVCASANQKSDFTDSEQDIHKSIKMAHQTYLYLSLYMDVISTGAVMGNVDGSEDDIE